jgi:hypothetical protein
MLQSGGGEVLWPEVVGVVAGAAVVAVVPPPLVRPVLGCATVVWLPLLEPPEG